MPERPVSPKATSTPPEKSAEAPFDDPQADLILQSSDEVHFRVFKLILSLASPIFKDMFSIPSPPSKKPDDEVQVVHLTEHSTALDVFLRHMYPVRSPNGDKLLYASILAEFARKYQVESLDVSITAYLKDSIERDPVGVYAIAVTYGYNDVRTSAARSCLRLPSSGLLSSYLRCATAEHISDLMRYHAACGEAASAVAASDRTWFSALDVNGFFAAQRRHDSGTTCQSCSMPDVTDPSSTYVEGQPSRRLDDSLTPAKPAGWTGRAAPRCMWNYLHRSALVLAHHPSVEAITTEAFVLKFNLCDSCAQSMRGHLLQISVFLAWEVRRAVEQVGLSLYPLSHACNVQWCMGIRDRFPYPRVFRKRPSRSSATTTQVL